MARKKVTGEDGKTYVMKEKKPFYKKIWFWILAVVALAIIGGALGGGSDSSTPTASKDGNTSASTAEQTSLKDNFDKVVIGDIFNGGEGGSSLEEVKAVFGEPDSTSETNIEGQTAKMMTWGGLKGGDIMSSIVVSFSNDKAVSKAVTGLKVDKHDKATLEQFNAVATDGTFSEDQARQQFGEPDGISDSLVNGQKQSLLTWSKNVAGDAGANFNITFDGGTATSKAQLNMK